MAYWRRCALSSIRQIVVLGCRTSSTHLHGMSSVTSSTSLVHGHTESSVTISPHVRSGASGNLLVLIDFERVTHVFCVSQKEAREPGFPMEICDRTFELARTHLIELNYHGPVALACDDTKLFAALRLFWNKKEESYFLVGVCGGPLRVPDVETAREVLENPKIKKATKVCNIYLVPQGINQCFYSGTPMVYDDPCGWDCTDRPCYVTGL